MTLNEVEKNVPMSSILALENVDISWHLLCKDQDLRKEINKLYEPALPHECNLWNIDDLKDMNLDELSDKPTNNNNYKDYLEYYSLLGANLCQKTLPAEINKQYRFKKMNY